MSCLLLGTGQSLTIETLAESNFQTNVGLSDQLLRRFSQWLSRDVVESQLLGRGVRRANSTRNHALSGCARLIRLFLRCLLLPKTRDDSARSQGPT